MLAGLRTLTHGTGVRRRVNRYTSVQDVTVSDHKPVVMTMDVAVESWEKDWRAQAGMAEDRVIVMRGLGCCIR